MRWMGTLPIKHVVPKDMQKILIVYELCSIVDENFSFKM